MFDEIKAWFTRQPTWVRVAFSLGSALLLAFSNRLPDVAQEIGYVTGLVLAVIFSFWALLPLSKQYSVVRFGMALTLIGASYGWHVTYVSLEEARKVASEISQEDSEEITSLVKQIGEMQEKLSEYKESKTNQEMKSSYVAMGSKNKDIHNTYKGPARGGSVPAVAMKDNNRGVTNDIQVDPGAYANNLINESDASKSYFHVEAKNPDLAPLGGMVYHLAQDIMDFARKNQPADDFYMLRYHQQFDSRVSLVCDALYILGKISASDRSRIENPTTLSETNRVGMDLDMISYPLINARQ